MFKRIAIAAVTGAAAGIILGAALFFITVELDDGQRWDFTTWLSS